MQNEIPLSPESAAMVMKAVPFARGLAKQFHRARLRTSHVDLDDLEGAALLGLCDSALRFDESRGMSFRTFSYCRVRGEMWDLLRRDGGISRAHFRRLMDQTNAATLLKEGKAPEADADDESNDDHYNLPYIFTKSAAELVSYSSAFGEYGISLSINAEKGNVDLSYVDEVSPEGQVAEAAVRRYVHQLLTRLPSRERKVLQLRYFENLSFEEIGGRMGAISKSLVSRLHAQGLESLRTLLLEDRHKCQELIRQTEAQQYFARAA